jgi:hypothetical protein
VSQPPTRLAVRAWNQLVRARASRSAISRLSADSLRECAVRRTNLTDFGADSFEQPLERLVDSINTTAALHPFGASLARAMLTALLCNRLYVEHAWRADARIARAVIRRPIVILGLPRTGTTYLFSLLANDPELRFLTNWEASRPAPPPGKWHSKTAVRRAVSCLGLTLQHYLSPALRTIHETKIDGPEECTSLLMAEFACTAFGATFNTPDYLAWLEDYDFTPVVRYHRRQLMVVDSQGPASRWLLKSPNHLPGLAALLHTYPDACIVQLHRDPAEAIPSCCSLVAAFRGIFTDRLDEREIRSQTVRTLEHALRRAAAAREGVSPGRFLDIHYDSLVAEPLRVVRSLYRHFDLKLSPAAEARIDRAIAASASRMKSSGAYSAPRNATDRVEIRSAFDWYISRFHVPLHG